MAVGALGLYTSICIGVFNARPLLIDEIVQVFQARIYATGRLSVPLPAHPEFFSNLHIVEHGGRAFAQFPPGHPFLLAVGELARVPWLITPVCGALAVFLFALLLRTIEPDPGIAAGAAMIFALSPFMAFLAGSYMNHAPALMFIVGALLALQRVARANSSAPFAAMALGLCLGAAAAIRPVDALAFAIPAAAWLVLRAIHSPVTFANVLSAGVGITLPLLCVMWVNAHTTGGPLLFGYELLWGKSHALGFHDAPWGPAHTPARGLALISLYFLRLQRYLFEIPLPSLLPIVVALGLATSLSNFDRYLIVASGCLVALYFAYWHDGFYLGPRFMLPLMPALALWTARSLSTIADRAGRGSSVHRTAVYAAMIAVALGTLTELPLRVRQYHNGLLTMRWDADRAAATANVRNALVLVKESWGAQRIARMWALGLTAPETEHLFANTDACRSEQTIDSLERAHIVGRQAFDALSRLLVDSARVRRVELPSSAKEPMIPGSRYARKCVERINDDNNGFTLHLPLILARSGGNIYARDLHARDTLLLTDFPKRPIWVLRPRSANLGAEPEFTEASRDSLSSAWQQGR